MNIKIVTERSRIPLFSRLLSGGFRVEVQTGAHIPELLCRQLKIPEDYLENSVQTVFLDGKPADNLRDTIVTDGMVIALSAAMPGLVGATMRRGGYYASMRQSISYQPGAEERIGRRKGNITLKLFNTVVRDLGPAFLEQGIRVSGGHLLRLLDDIGQRSAENESRVSADESEITWEELRAILQTENDIHLQVISKPQEA